MNLSTEPPLETQYVINHNAEFLKKHIDQELIPARDSTQKFMIDSRREIGAAPPKLDNIGQYNYRYEQVYGTEKLGLAPQISNTKTLNEKHNPLIYPNTIYNTLRAKYINV